MQEALRFCSSLARVPSIRDCKKKFSDSVDITFDNGTNRQAFFKGQISSYSWVDKGSNYALSEYLAAALYPLLEEGAAIMKVRRGNWDRFNDLLSAVPEMEPYLPKGLSAFNHNGHVFYLKAKDKADRTRILRAMKAKGIEASFHYVPLHSSAAGQHFCRFHGEDKYTTSESERLFRLPVHNLLTQEQLEYTVDSLVEVIKG